MYLADLKTFWLTDLDTILPTASVYLSIAPENPPFPYAVLTDVGTVPTYLTGTGHFAHSTFRIAVWDRTASGAYAIALQIGNVLDMSKPSANSILCKRTDGPVILADETEPQRVFSAVLTYDLSQNATVGNLS